jgi:hypothetical protein
MNGSLNNRFSRALEGPIEATLELKDNLSQFLPTVIKTNLMIVLALVAFWLIFLIENLFLIMEIVQLYRSGHVPMELELWVFFGVKGIFLLIFALTLAVLLFLTQTLRFIGKISGKYRIIESMTEQEVDEERQEHGVLQGMSKYNGDPIKAILDLLDDVDVQMPQLIRMYRVSIILLACLPVIMGFSLFYTFMYGDLLGFSVPWYLKTLGIINIILKFIFILLCLFSIYFSYLCMHFFLLFQKRRMVIDDVRFDMDLRVPKGKTEVERFVLYLSRTEPLLVKSRGVEPLEKGVQVGKTKLDGMLRAKVRGLSRLYTLGEREAAVFIKVIDRRLKKEDVKNFGESVREYVKANKVYPLRIAIILKGSAKDLDDDVYSYVLENPSFRLNLERHYVQLVSEEEGQYSFIPNIGSPP